MRADFPADLPLIPIDEAPPLRRRRPDARTVAHHAAVWSVVIAIVVVSFVAGLHVRKWTWEMTDPIHFVSDIRRGFGWGMEAATNGYLNLYEKMSAQEARWNNWLDYAPLRLAVMTFWGYQTKANYPGVTQWQADWEFNKPVLLFNTAMEAIGAICAFFIVRVWLRRASDDPKPFTGWPAGLAAALLFWFNPAVHLSAHGWPTWDMWIIPMYLLAVLLASYNCWFAAGLAVAAGAMFKGQQLAVAPVFLIWPLVMLRFDAMLKWTIGVVFGVALLASPWLLTYVPQEAIAAMRVVQFDGVRPPWDASRLTLPERVVDGGLIAWLALVLVTSLAVPLVLRRVDRVRPGGQPSGPSPMYSWERLGEGDFESRKPLETQNHLHPTSPGVPGEGPDGPRATSHTPSKTLVSAYVAGCAGMLVLLNLHRVIDVPTSDADLFYWVALFALCVIVAIVAGALMASRTQLPARPMAVVMNKRLWLFATIALASFLVAYWPWMLSANRGDWSIGLSFAIPFAAVIPFVRRPTHIALLAAGAVGVGLLSSMWYFHGSSAWWVCGWKYGTFHWRVMQMGVSSNLPGILQQRYGWRHPEQLVEIWEMPPDVLFGYPKFVKQFTIEQVLKTIYAVTLLLTAVGVGIQARRRDPRVLVALTAPWLMFFCFPVQIHERYLLYAAGVGAITIGAGLGPALLVVFMSAVTWMMTLHVMLNHGSGNGTRGREELGRLMAEQFPSLFTNQSGHELHRLIVGTYPDIGWAVLLCAGIFLYLSLTPSRKRRTREKVAPVALGQRT